MNNYYYFIRSKNSSNKSPYNVIILFTVGVGYSQSVLLRLSAYLPQSTISNPWYYCLLFNNCIRLNTGFHFGMLVCYIIHGLTYYFIFITATILAYFFLSPTIIISTLTMDSFQDSEQMVSITLTIIVTCAKLRTYQYCVTCVGIIWYFVYDSK